MKRLGILLLLIAFSSCQFFETEKISSETFYEEELKNIEWNEVDVYPAFSVCEESTETSEQMDCFIKTLSHRLYASIQQRNIVASQDLNHEVNVAFSISKTGALEIQKIEMDSLVRLEIPLLETWLRESIDSLPKANPAYKRGIPVNTEFVLPIKISTTNL